MYVLCKTLIYNIMLIGKGCKVTIPINSMIKELSNQLKLC